VHVYEYLTGLDRHAEPQWSRIWEDGKAYSAEEAHMLLKHVRDSNVNRHVIYHAIVPCQ